MKWIPLILAVMTGVQLFLTLTHPTPFGWAMTLVTGLVYLDTFRER